MHPLRHFFCFLIVYNFEILGLPVSLWSDLPTLFLILNSVALPLVMKEYSFLSVCAMTPIGEPYSMQHTGEMRGGRKLLRLAAGDR